jgi:LPS-assembly lipoprotein
MPGRRAFLALGAVLLLPLPGCGWAPLYADPQSGPASEELRAIRVAPIPERIGQRLEMALRNSLNPSGEPAKERYVLRTTLSVSLIDLGIQSQGTATLGRLDVVATYVLADSHSGSALLTNTLHVQNSFALNPNQYSTVVGEDDSGVRAVAELNQEMVARLTLFMEHRAAEKTPKRAEAS